MIGAADEVVEGSWKSGHSASNSPPCSVNPSRDLALTSIFLHDAITFA